MVPQQPKAGDWLYRHRLATRAWHWLNAVAIVVLIGSGAMISNAHPRLYWGVYGANPDRAWAELPRFPGWLTIPSHYNLALGRRWHLFFAAAMAFGLLAYMLWGVVARQFGRVVPARRELTRRHLLADLVAHWNLRFHDPEHPGAYNTFQKLSYFGILFLALPLAILTGIALSPGMDAGFPWVLDVLGGRQSARSIHFVAAVAISLFTIVHLALVILAGAGHELRSMVTGWWRVPEEDA
jgi:Ni/Fe-hydrogenase b-type cytochrome subunit